MPSSTTTTDTDDKIERRLVSIVVILIVLVVAFNSGFFDQPRSSSSSRRQQEQQRQHQQSANTVFGGGGGGGNSAPVNAVEEQIPKHVPHPPPAPVTASPLPPPPPPSTPAILEINRDIHPARYVPAVPIEMRDGRTPIPNLPDSLLGADGFPLRALPEYGMPALTDTEVGMRKFCIMRRAVPPGLGLSTQLVVYMHLIAAVIMSDRALIFPMARAPFFLLVNMTASTFPRLGRNASFSYVATPETYRRVMKHRPIGPDKSLQLTREYSYGNPTRQHTRLFGFTRKANRLIVLPSMYKLFPFGAEANVNFGKMLCGIVFNNRIERLAQRTMESLANEVSSKKSTSSDGGDEFRDRFSADEVDVDPSSAVYYRPPVRYISVHLRIEPQDSVAFRRGRPTPQQLRDFFEQSIVPLCVKHKTLNVFVASGPLGQEYNDVLASEFFAKSQHRLRIFNRSRLTRRDFVPVDEEDDKFFAEAKNVVKWERTRISPTNTRTAAVDMLVLQHGVATVLSAFSSLTPTVYARRCYRGPRCLGAMYWRGGPRGVRERDATNYLYEIGDDGALTKARPHKCGYRMQELLRGGGAVDPPADEDLFAENVRKNRTMLFE